MSAEGQAADYAARIGARIRELRQKRGLSLSALALEAGIGKATLSGLEDGSRGNPTIETLYAVAGRLGVPLAAILPDPARSLGAPAAEPPEIRGAAVAAVLLESFSEGDTVTELFRLHIRPGREQVSPPHPPGTVEYLTVFSGTARVGPVGATVVVPAGGHVSWTADGPHSYAAVGEEDVFASLLIRTFPSAPDTLGTSGALGGLRGADERDASSAASTAAASGTSGTSGAPGAPPPEDGGGAGH